MNLTLVLVICLAGNPSTCQELPQVPEDGHQITQFDCMANAQRIASNVLSEWPGWKLDHWACQLGKRERT